jgi:hypothetical protein
MRAGLPFVALIAAVMVVIPACRQQSAEPLGTGEAVRTALMSAAPGEAEAEPAEAEPAEARMPLAVDEGDDFGFRFVRVRYDSRGRGFRGRGAWATDYPTAEENLHMAIEQTTSITLEGPPIFLTFLDDAIYQHPVLYLTEPGYWITSPQEVERMQTYFARGGFLIVDDFHDYGDGQTGPEWENFYDNIKQVFPEREPVELPPEHPIWSIYYDIDPLAAMSTKRMSGEVPWLDIDDDTYYGIFDDNGRMMVVICYNQDIGDGWEWPGGRNLGEASTVSFQMAINFIQYALTH